jgi:hypothetical protein
VAAHASRPEFAAARRARDEGADCSPGAGADPHEVIQAQRRYLVQLMQQWTPIKEDEADGDLGLALAVDAKLFRMDSVVRWLDVADAHLKRAEAGTAAPNPNKFERRCHGTGGS